jgi:hypothetical protein
VTATDSSSTRVAGSRDGALPTFLIIGAMKSGTSALCWSLRRHPDVFVHPAKEAHFFDERWEKGVRWYRAGFEGRDDARAWGEATPEYMRSAALCAPRIAETVPGAALIAILRDPVDRAYSHYWHQRARGRESLSFEDAIEAELHGTRAVRGRMDFRYVDGSRYASQLDEYLARFPRESLLVLDFERFSAAPVDVMRRVFAHVGVREDVPVAIPDEPVNPYRRPRSMWLRRRLQGREGRAAKLLDQANMRTSRYPVLRPATRARLIEVLAPERAALAERYGITVPEWER